MVFVLLITIAIIIFIVLNNVSTIKDALFTKKNKKRILNIIESYYAKTEEMRCHFVCHSEEIKFIKRYFHLIHME